MGASRAAYDEIDPVSEVAPLRIEFKTSIETVYPAACGGNKRRSYNSVLLRTRNLLL